MAMKMRIYGCLLVAAVCLTFTNAAEPELPTGTTAWPEICRVMALYKTCDDVSFRVACSYLCADAAASCISKNMIYIPSKGKCYGMTVTAQNLWAFAWDSCEWYGTTLATLKDAKDAEVLAYLKTKVGNTQSKIIVGAINVGKSDEWVHVDGTLVDNSFWVSSKPTGQSKVNCMHSDTGSQYKQNNDDCGQNRGFVCEF
ncbi:tetranectin-like protein [Ruditapes philippinarum]|uniref:tetranectin-like protein n=1 Tax=Ruditapes philippinarum TaxID=129788 RepID=UPI00295AD04A|nr:tetranectin-like protein [Ruditapes philippinarum]